MTRRERRSRPDRPSLERSLDALLDRSWPGRDGPGPGGPGEDPARWQPVAQVLAALTSAPESSELTAEARALAEFRALADRPARASGARFPPQAPQRDPGWKTWLRPGRPAVAAATGAVLVGGLLVVAYTGDLPAPVQRLAHDTIDAPAAGGSGHPDPPGPTRPASPLRTGASQAGQPGNHGSARTDRRTSRGSGFGSRHQHRPSGFPPGTSGYRTSGSPDPSRTGQSGSPGGFPTPQPSQPQPSQQPSPSASASPPGSATPSPSAAPSPTHRSRPHSPQPGLSLGSLASVQSLPP